MGLLQNQCRHCGDNKWLWQKRCVDCGVLLQCLQQHWGQLGFGPLLDALLATGVDRQKVRRFFETDADGQGSIRDRLTAQLSNDLAQGMGVKTQGMTADDVKRLRHEPQGGVSTKPLDR